MFTFLFHDLYMPWSWALGITTPPFKNCSVSQGLKLHNFFTVNILATLLLVVFARKIIESLGHGFLNKPHSRYQLIFFFCLWGNHSLVSDITRKTDLGSPVQLCVPYKAALPSPSTQCSAISHLQKTAPWIAAWTRPQKWSAWKVALKTFSK